MKTRLFYTTGNRDIIETTWDKPEPTDDQLEVQAVLTGVCRSDIDMFTGDFPMLPKEIQGHEGLGIVTKAGKNLKNSCGGAQVGDYVATRGEPAFSDYYNVNKDEFVVVPDLEPKYILEPVACGLNLMGPQEDENKTSNFLNFEVSKANRWNQVPQDAHQDILILGTGFLATTLYTGINQSKDFGKCNVTVVGNANKEFWIKQNVDFVQHMNEIPKDIRFEKIFDISSKPSYLTFAAERVADAGLIVMASEKKPNPSWPMQELLWKSATVAFPSPRSTNFIRAMGRAHDLVAWEDLDTSKLWTQGYDRGTEVMKAFNDGLNRKEGYSRGYIRW